MDPNQVQAPGSVPSFNTHPQTGPTTLRKLLRVGVPNRPAVRMAGNAPARAPTLVSMVTSQGQQRQPHSLETKEPPIPRALGR